MKLGNEVTVKEKNAPENNSESLGNKLPMREKMFFGMGSIGKDMVYGLLATYFMLFCTDVDHLAPGFVGILLFVARIVDAFCDPLMGTIVDNTRTKIGKFRPWILVGCLVNSVVLVFLFYNPLGVIDPRHVPTSLYVYASITYVLFCLSYTIIDVPYWSMVASLTSDPHERDSASMIPRIFAGIGNILVTALTLVVVPKLGQIGTPYASMKDPIKEIKASKMDWLSMNQAVDGVNRNGYFRWTLIIIAIYIFFIMITVVKSREHVIIKNPEKITFRKAMKTIYSNDQLLIAVVTLILVNVAINMTTGVAAYYFRWVWGNDDYMSKFTLILGASVAISMVLYPTLAKKFTRKKVFTTAMVLPIIGYVIMYFVGKVFIGNVAVLGAVAFIVCSGFGCITVLTSVMIADTVEYGEWKLGYRSEGIIVSMQTFLVKFATALTAIIAGPGLQIFGYNSTLKAQSQSTLNGIQFLMFAVPPVLMLIALIVYLKKYKLNGEYYKNILLELKTRHEAE